MTIFPPANGSPSSWTRSRIGMSAVAATGFGPRTSATRTSSTLIGLSTSVCSRYQKSSRRSRRSSPRRCGGTWRRRSSANGRSKAYTSAIIRPGSPSRTDEELAERIALGREIASLGRAARTAAKLKVRQPLAKVEIVLADQRHREWLKEYDAAVRDELNVKEIEYLQSADQYITYTVLPDLKRLGPKLGKRLPLLKQKLAEADAAALLARLKNDGKVTLGLTDGDITLDNDDIQVRLQAKPGWSAAQGTLCVVVLNTELTEELIAEGLARRDRSGDPGPAQGDELPIHGPYCRRYRDG